MELLKAISPIIFLPQVSSTPHFGFNLDYILNYYWIMWLFIGKAVVALVCLFSNWKLKLESAKREREREGGRQYPTWERTRKVSLGDFKEVVCRVLGPSFPLHLMPDQSNACTEYAASKPLPLLFLSQLLHPTGFA